MLYDNIPKTLFDKFVNENCLDYAKCQSIKPGSSDSKKTSLEIEINVKNMNQNTGGYSKDSKNINEIFKFTC